MDPILAYAKDRERDMVALCRELVECESPSGDEAGVASLAELISERLSGLADCSQIPGGACGPHLKCVFRLGGREDGQILALGHLDTVHAVGSFGSAPFREADGRLWGPGVLDMKAGIVFLIFAVRALRDLGIPMRRRVLLQLKSDEEVGSESSRPITEEEARRSAAVLVLEPGTGLEGKLKTARKGVGDYILTVHGKAAHSGLDFTAGASAVLELARQIQKIARFTDLERGITVNPGVISGGTRPNVVAAEARAEIDMRVVRVKDAAVLDRRFRALRPADNRCSLSISGGLNRPPMERTPGVVRLFQMAQTAARELGVELEESLSGGGSDGNFTAALGIPTLDGLGAVGEGAHAPHESILVNRMADRTALIAKLLQAL